MRFIRSTFRRYLSHVSLQLLGIGASGRDRSFRLPAYKQALVGSELLDWMSGQLWCASRARAIELGQMMLNAGYLQPAPPHADHVSPSASISHLPPQQQQSKRGSIHSLGSFSFAGPLSLHAPASDPRVFSGGETLYKLGSGAPDSPTAEEEKEEGAPPTGSSAGSKPDFDLLVIGGGSAGIAAATFAEKLGVRVALVERGRLGGDATWAGAVPLAALAQVAKVMHAARGAASYGVHTGAVKVDMVHVRAHIMRAIHDVYSLESTPAHLARRGIEVIHGAAAFVDATTVEVTPASAAASGGGALASGAASGDEDVTAAAWLGSAALSREPSSRHSFRMRTGSFTSRASFHEPNDPKAFAGLDPSPSSAALGPGSGLPPRSRAGSSASAAGSGSAANESKLVDVTGTAATTTSSLPAAAPAATPSGVTLAAGSIRDAVSRRAGSAALLPSDGGVGSGGDSATRSPGQTAEDLFEPEHKAAEQARHGAGALSRGKQFELGRHAATSTVRCSSGRRR